MDLRRLLTYAFALAVLALAVLPAAVVFGRGWLTLADGSGGPRDPGTPLEAWVAFALFYVVWALALMALVAVVNERLGRRWHPYDRPRRPGSRERRRRLAGLRFLAGQQGLGERPAGRPAARRRGDGRR